jgi:hypothetical protein
VEYDIWYSSASASGLKFINDFELYNRRLGRLIFNSSILGKNVLMTPHFVLWTCPSCDSNQIEEDCFANGQYCAPPIQGKKNSKNNYLGFAHICYLGKSYNGRAILNEDVRQKCIYNEVYNNETDIKWWEYMECFSRECGDLKEDCSKKCMKEVGINVQRVLDCHKKAIDDAKDQKEKHMFKDEMRAWINANGAFFPAVIINNRTYRVLLIHINRINREI